MQVGDYNNDNNNNIIIIIISISHTADNKILQLGHVEKLWLYTVHSFALIDFWENIDHKIILNILLIKQTHTNKKDSNKIKSSKL